MAGVRNFVITCLGGESVESFLQIEKRSGIAPFTHYYKSILNKAASRKLVSKTKFEITWPHQVEMIVVALGRNRKFPLGVSGIGVLLRWSTQRKEIV
ncbi:hypothetical protein K1719_043921 [Acacia pycnantha]|nr:hypothetical protein K1719_043921 [Acacia pycnantha]